MIKPVQKANPASSRAKRLVAAGKIKKRNVKMEEFRLILEEGLNK